MNVVIAGAGAEGGDLRTAVVSSQGAVLLFSDYSAPAGGTTAVVLDRPATTTVRGAAVRYQPLTLRRIGRG